MRAVFWSLLLFETYAYGIYGEVCQNGLALLDGEVIGFCNFDMHIPKPIPKPVPVPEPVPEVIVLEPEPVPEVIVPEPEPEVIVLPAESPITISKRSLLILLNSLVACLLLLALIYCDRTRRRFKEKREKEKKEGKDGKEAKKKLEVPFKRKGILERRKEKKVAEKIGVRPIVPIVPIVPTPTPTPKPKPTPTPKPKPKPMFTLKPKPAPILKPKPKPAPKPTKVSEPEVVPLPKPKVIPEPSKPVYRDAVNPNGKLLEDVKKAIDNAILVPPRPKYLQQIPKPIPKVFVPTLEKTIEKIPNPVVSSNRMLTQVREVLKEWDTPQRYPGNSWVGVEKIHLALAGLFDTVGVEFASWYSYPSSLRQSPDGKDWRLVVTTTTTESFTKPVVINFHSIACEGFWTVTTTALETHEIELSRIAFIRHPDPWVRSILWTIQFANLLEQPNFSFHSVTRCMENRLKLVEGYRTHFNWALPFIVRAGANCGVSSTLPKIALALNGWRTNNIYGSYDKPRKHKPFGLITMDIDVVCTQSDIINAIVHQLIHALLSEECKEHSKLFHKIIQEFKNLTAGRT